MCNNYLLRIQQYPVNTTYNIITFCTTFEKNVLPILSMTNWLNIEFITESDSGVYDSLSNFPKETKQKKTQTTFKSVFTM